MKQFLLCGLLFAVFVCFVGGSTVEERRLRDGNSFARKLKSCNLICGLKGNRSQYNQTRCYRIPSQNVVATDCAFRCLRLKGESPDATECVCRNGVCIEQTTTTTEAPETTEASTTTESENPTQTTVKGGKLGNQEKKGLKSQTSKNRNPSKQKS